MKPTLTAVLVSWLVALPSAVQAASYVQTVAESGLRVGPAAHLPVIEPLPASSRLTVLERSGGWYRVRADRMLEGWVPLFAVRFIPGEHVPASGLSRLQRGGLSAVVPRHEEATALSAESPSPHALRAFAGDGRLIRRSAR